MKEYFSWSIKKVKEEIGLPDIVVNNAGSYYMQVDQIKRINAGWSTFFSILNASASILCYVFLKW